MSQNGIRNTPVQNGSRTLPVGSASDPNIVRIDVKLSLQIVYRSLHIDEPDNPDLPRRIDTFVNNVDTWPDMSGWLRNTIRDSCKDAGSFYRGVNEALFRAIIEEFAWNDAFSLAREFEFFLPPTLRLEIDDEEVEDRCARLLVPNPPGQEPEWETWVFGRDPEVTRRIREERLAARVMEWERMIDID